MSVSLKVLTTPSIAMSILRATFDGMDLLFYAIAAVRDTSLRGVGPHEVNTVG